jgi:hypothetical protein
MFSPDVGFNSECPRETRISSIVPATYQLYSVDTKLKNDPGSLSSFLCSQSHEIFEVELIIYPINSLTGIGTPGRIILPRDPISHPPILFLVCRHLGICLPGRYKYL